MIIKKIDLQLIDIILPFKNKITELNVYQHSNTTKPIDFSQFIHLNKLSIKCFKDFQLCECFKNQFSQLERINIQMINHFNSSLIKILWNYNIKYKTIILSDEKSIKEVLQIPYIQSKFMICCDKWFNGIDDSILLLFDKYLELNCSKGFDSFIIDMYFPSKIILTGITQSCLDFSSFTQLQEIQSYSKYSINYPTSLTKLEDCFYLYTKTFPFLKNITIIQNDNDIEIPSTVTDLVIFKSNGKIYNAENVRQLTLSNHYFSFESFNLLTSISLTGKTFKGEFQNLSNLSILYANDVLLESPHFPSSLQFLSCRYSNSLKFPPNLIQLELSNVNKQLDIQYLKKLTSLTLISTQTTSFLLNNNIYQLHLIETSNNIKIIDLSYYTSLTFIELNNVYNQPTLILPSSTHSLILENCNAYLSNIESIALQNVALINSLYNLEIPIKIYYEKNNIVQI
ncbi:hypothetical protein EHI8A_029410 [Entamoeba histolytica HM-1:IMSS-B]|uniref:Leucine-rich repeat containing protein n=5 Tax=Entamoeba histolytica TaxID=5759 RepID=C4M663_ENTH1|nr:hypothetical protein EHI_042950 [Entamoeba histolytica HM-1:IMSS]EMD47381.1 Hypothetical protein EHI5A_056530 [Entamoeba histolytica KU27]EMH72538.1 hypothetical protein EHI8A_029410 [Entamoeba histolytica HM-1:IMSS-B]ENY61044.1 hypothetical protein EHI7A_032470 [Entamoeba histolytica HM-1:IMSS-A]GAT96947.1 hypothetical protein CL6EHI_042950 [Entamoeba histolytica]EAL47254.2 hypothetical protein EHI_042950 [Entamoeba histolytica HM-1:IMSS]|eukprot:XP_652640.2 hypothetical protein EHI_042950 [Entamoeba histolytica HM-1:IMSS]